LGAADPLALPDGTLFLRRMMGKSYPHDKADDRYACLPGGHEAFIPCNGVSHFA